MEFDQFDELSRTLSTADSSRRLALRALGSLLLGSAAARLGWTEIAQAKSKRKRKRHKKKRRSPSSQPCGAACTADGGRCCPDGSCAQSDACCPGERRCADGSCIAPNQCCPEAIPPTCGECQEVVCEGGDLVCRSTCQGEGALCCNGGCVNPCRGGKELNPATCQCECPSGSELLLDGETCCPIPRACGRKNNPARVATVCCTASDHCCDDFDICVGEGSACE